MLEQAWQIGKAVGLHFVYLSTVNAHRLENSYCPGCRALLIERQGLRLFANRLREGRCPDCGQAVAGRWG